MGYIKKSRPWLGRLSFSLSDLFHSHRCHPNRKQSFNNKDYNKDDNKGETEDGIHRFWFRPIIGGNGNSSRAKISESDMNNDYICLSRNPPFSQALDTSAPLP